MHFKMPQKVKLAVWCAPHTARTFDARESPGSFFSHVIHHQGKFRWTYVIWYLQGFKFKWTSSSFRWTFLHSSISCFFVESNDLQFRMNIIRSDVCTTNLMQGGGDEWGGGGGRGWSYASKLRSRREEALATLFYRVYIINGFAWNVSCMSWFVIVVVGGWCW